MKRYTLCKSILKIATQPHKNIREDALEMVSSRASSFYLTTNLLGRLYRKYVLAPADKAANNVVVV